MDELAAFGDIEGEVGGLVNAEDLDHVAANLPEGNSALVIVWEDLWAKPLAEALRGVGWGAGRQRPHPGRPRRGGVRGAGAGAQELRTERPKRERSTTMPMMRRRPVMRTVGRTAVIAGTATVVAGGVYRHQQKKYAAAGGRGAAAAGRAARRAPVEAAPGLRRADQQAEGARQPEGPGHPDRGRVQRPEGEDPGRDVLTPGTRCRPRPAYLPSTRHPSRCRSRSVRVGCAGSIACDATARARPE